MPAPISFTRLPDPPWLEHALLESPWLLVGGLVSSGVVVLVLLNRAGRARTGVLIALGTILVGAALAALSAAVQTAREDLAARTRALVEVALRNDQAALELVLGAGMVFDVLGDVARNGKDAAMGLVARYVPLYPLRSSAVTDLRAVEDGPDTGRSQFQLVVVPEATRFPHASWWTITWRRGGDGAWRVWSIKGEQIDGVGGGAQLRP